MCQEAPAALRAKKKKSWRLASSWHTLTLKFPARFNTEASPQTSGAGTPPPTAPLPCEPKATRAGTKESVRVALVSQFPSGAGLSRQRNREERHHLFTAPSNINATRQEGAGGLSPCGEERKWKPARSHPPRLTGPAPVFLQLSPREGPAFALPTTAVATSNSAEN